MRLIMEVDIFLCRLAGAHQSSMLLRALWEDVEFETDKRRALFIGWTGPASDVNWLEVDILAYSSRTKTAAR